MWGRLGDADGAGNWESYQLICINIYIYLWIVICGYLYLYIYIHSHPQIDGKVNHH